MKINKRIALALTNDGRGLSDFEKQSINSWADRSGFKSFKIVSKKEITGHCAITGQRTTCIEVKSFRR